jgi:hypothetical protein
MNRIPGTVVLFTLLSAISLLASAQESAAQQLTGADQSIGYPYVGGKGPGMGRGYQQAAPGPGRGNPNYRGGNSGGADMPAGSVTVDQAATAAAAATDEAFYPVPGWPQYRGSRGYGLGYPYADQGAYPYRRRGAGYGPGRRGYGYGYPGYRGRGGTGYPGHRQYGNPPFYQSDEAATD